MTLSNIPRAIVNELGRGIEQMRLNPEHRTAQCLQLWVVIGLDAAVDKLEPSARHRLEGQALIACDQLDLRCPGRPDAAGVHG